jgi:hypothetical protein
VGTDSAATIKVSYLVENILEAEHPIMVNHGAMRQPLHRHIGLLCFRNKENDSIGRGTGVLISPNLVLTAAQNVWSRTAKADNYEFMFYPGLNGDLKGYKKIEQISFPNHFKPK